MVSRGALVALSYAMLLCLSTAALAGTMTIENRDCTALFWFQTKNWVEVHVYTSNRPLSGASCTVETIRVDKGQTKTVTLVTTSGTTGKKTACNYYHEAIGTILGHADISGSSGGEVICRKGGLNVCQCNKNY